MGAPQKPLFIREPCNRKGEDSTRPLSLGNTFKHVNCPSCPQGWSCAPTCSSHLGEGGRSEHRVLTKLLSQGSTFLRGYSSPQAGLLPPVSSTAGQGKWGPAAEGRPQPGLEHEDKFGSARHGHADRALALGSRHAPAHGTPSAARAGSAQGRAPREPLPPEAGSAWPAPEKRPCLCARVHQSFVQRPQAKFRTRNISLLLLFGYFRP